MMIIHDQKNVISYSEIIWLFTYFPVIGFFWTFEAVPSDVQIKVE